MAQHDLIQARFKISDLEEDIEELTESLARVRKNFSLLIDFCKAQNLVIPHNLYLYD